MVSLRETEQMLAGAVVGQLKVTGKQLEELKRFNEHF